MAIKGWLTEDNAWPNWVRMAAPVTVGLLALGAIGSCSGGDSASKVRASTTTTTAEFRTISETTGLALAAAKAAGLTEAQTTSLVRWTCNAAGDTAGADTLARQIIGLDVDQAHLKPLIGALGNAAEADCPEAVADAPDMLNVTYAAGIVLLKAATTATTEATTTTLATTTTIAPTTAAPPPPTEPPPAPPTAYYANCDAVRAAGAAPIHRGEPGYSAKLDRDGDGIACE